MNTKRVSILLLCCLSWCMCKAQQPTSDTALKIARSEDPKVIETIRAFYTAYTDDQGEETFSEAAEERYFTKRMIAKLQRLISVTDADPVIRAQDFDPEAFRKKLSVKHLADNWYMVSYVQTHDGSRVDIPLRMVPSNGQYKIDYITPAWNNALYGDSLWVENPVPQPLDTSAPLSLLETFYKAYATLYYSMPEDLIPRLQELRKKVCMPQVLSQFQEAAAEQEADGWPGYDLLLNNFDFDRQWMPSLRFAHLEGDEYEVSYVGSGFITTVQLHLVRQGDEYRIGSVQMEQ